MSDDATLLYGMESSVDSDRYCYGQMVHVGVSCSPAILANVAPSLSERAWDLAWIDWKRRVAEPFFERMQRWARRDELLIDYAVGGDPTVDFMVQYAYARLLRPNGEPYKVSVRGLASASELLLMDEDWGETLAQAQARNPYDYKAEGRNPRHDRLPEQ